MPEIERSRGWIIAAVVLATGFIAGLGPGVKFHSLLQILAPDSWVSSMPETRHPRSLYDLSRAMSNTKAGFLLGSCRETIPMGTAPKQEYEMRDLRGRGSFDRALSFLVLNPEAVLGTVTRP